MNTWVVVKDLIKKKETSDKMTSVDRLYARKKGTYRTQTEPSKEFSIRFA